LELEIRWARGCKCKVTEGGPEGGDSHPSLAECAHVADSPVAGDAKKTASAKNKRNVIENSSSRPEPVSPTPSYNVVGQ